MADAPALQVLTCPKCGAAVPLAKAAHTRCLHCAAEVPVPDAHRQALEVAEQQVKADALTQRAFRSLGRPPVLPLRAFGFIGAGVTLGLACLYIQLIDALESKAFALAERLFSVNPYDWFTSAELWSVRWSTLALLCILGVVLGALGRRRAVRRAALKAALHAKPPEKPGGPALCRACGAPLTVPDGAWGVRCAYCLSDNLTAIPQVWLHAARRRVKDLAKQARDAIRQQRAVEADFRRDFFVNVGLVGAVAALAVGATVYRVAKQHPDPDWDLRAAFKVRRLIGREYTVRVTPVPVPSKVPLDGCRGHWGIPYDQYDCKGHQCSLGWFVALRAGETLKVVPRAKGTALLFEHVADHAWDAAYGGLTYWGREVAQTGFDEAKPALLKAPVTAWYRLHLDLLLDDPAAGIPLCAGVE